MERLTLRRTKQSIAMAAAGLALTGCDLGSIDSYLADPANVQCDERRTIQDLTEGGMATFIVHGLEKGDVATVKVRRSEEGASVNVTGNVTGPPQQLEEDGFTAPTPVVDGAELSAFGAGGAWVIDVRKDEVVIQGSCEGM